LTGRPRDRSGKRAETMTVAVPVFSSPVVPPVGGKKTHDEREPKIRSLVF
jgi:hypothetical protein